MICPQCKKTYPSDWGVCLDCLVDLAQEDATESLARAEAPEVEALLNRGMEHYNREEYDQAIAVFNAALKRAPNNAFAYFRRGTAYNIKGETGQAIADLTEAIRLNPNDADYYNNRGIAYDNDGEYDTAVQDYTEAIRLNPNDADHYHIRGNAYLLNEECDKAVQDYTEAIRLDPNDAFCYYNRGNAYLVNKECDKAVQDYTEAIRLNPNDADYYYNRGSAYLLNKECDKAVQDYTRLNPKCAEAYHFRGFAYLKKKFVNEALRDVRKAFKLDPATGASCHNMAVAWSLFDEDSPKGYEELGRKLAQMSAKEFKEYLETPPSDQSGNNSGWCFITSAACASFGKSDNCYELTAFRAFRDGWLSSQPDGEAIVADYYRIAPAIVSAINRRTDSAAVYSGIWNTYLEKCLRLIEGGQYENCKQEYMNMVRELEKEWL
jgi:tetratricopeptide (TPR) repeat protein